MSYQLPKELEPQPGELCATVPPHLAASALLFFDRIYWSQFMWAWPNRDDFQVHAAELAFAHPTEFETNYLGEALSRVGPAAALDRNRVSDEMRRIMAEKCQAAGYNVVPIYDSESSFRSEFKTGEHVTYQAAFANIPVVSPNDVTFEQVMEFRKDPDARRKYRDLRLWLQDGIEADSIEHASQIIEQRLDDYKWAIRKHGLNSVLGTISEIINWKNASAAGAIGIAATHMGNEMWGAIAAGLTVGVQASVLLAKKLVDREDVRRGAHCEVAFIYDVQKRF